MLTLLLLATFSGSLPELRAEATDGGSALVIRNTHPSQALTAYLVELVEYPGSSFAFSQDELAQGGEPLGAGQQRRIPIQNMTVGAVGDYVKMRAALYADGSSAGPDDKVAQLRARRALLLSTIREVLAHPAQLKAMLDAVPVSNSKLKRAAPEVVDQVSRRALIADAMEMEPTRLLEKFRAREAALSK